MSLQPGAHLSAYEILGLIGSGGMGMVYRARDPKLGRDVALKVLPEEFALDADRLARFRREAQVLASLNHPNIAAIYGLEEADGVRALVLEFVEGPTLADRIAHGAIPLDEALPIARQIADALEAAHEHGIVHRDLKPANIKLRPDGTVKVLDFGLAKALDSSPSATEVSQLPTITSPAMTHMGMILGTAAYMSPEQARGKPVDKRADIWAFGCVFYEMLAGTRAFRGTTFDELNGEISPDGRWVAYQSNESGQDEMYVRPFPEVNSGRWQVSTGGGNRPLWAHSGKELFYLAPGGGVMSVGVEGGAMFRAGSPTKLFEGPYLAPPAGIVGRTYDVSADGQRFLMIKQAASTDVTSAPPQIIVVQNWLEAEAPRAEAMSSTGEVVR